MCLQAWNFSTGASELRVRTNDRLISASVPTVVIPAAIRLQYLTSEACKLQLSRVAYLIIMGRFAEYAE